MVAWAHRHTVLTVTTATFFCTMFARVIISPLIPLIIQEFSVSKGAIGLALTGMWAVFALMQFPAGVLGERFGEHLIIFAALGFTALGSLLVAVSPSYVLFALLIVIVGVGAGLFMPVAGSLLTKLFPGTGRALGINSMGAPLGGLVGPVVATALAARFGWRAAPMAAAVFATAVLLGGILMVRPVTPERPNTAMRERFEPAAVLALLSRPPIVYTTILAIIGFFAYQSFTSFFPTFLVQYASVSTARASLVFGTVFGLAIGGAPLMGWLSDRFGRDPILAVGFAGGAFGLVVFMTSGGAVATVVGTVLLALGMSWPGVMNSRFMDLFTDAERGAGFGLARTGFLFVSSLGSVVTGSLADAFGWLVAYGVIVFIFLLAVGMMVANALLDTGY